MKLTSLKYFARVFINCQFTFRSFPTVLSSLLSSTNIISFNKFGAVRSYTETKVLNKVDLGSLMYVIIKLIEGNVVPPSSTPLSHVFAGKIKIQKF